MYFAFLAGAPSGLVPMTTPPLSANWRAEMRQQRARARAWKLRALGWAVAALLFGLCARQFASRATEVLAGPFYLPAEQLLFTILLLLGLMAMAALGQRPMVPATAVGLPLRTGWLREWGLGAALGWGTTVLLVLPVALTGGLLVTAAPLDAHLLLAVLTDLLTLLLITLAAELLFRGYAFARLVEAVGPSLATVGMTLLFAFVQVQTGTGGTVTSSILLGLVLSVAYLRTRALWVGWGLHFAWKASTAVLFGLPLGGMAEFSPFVSTYTSGPTWLTGGGHGPEASLLAIPVLLLLLVAVGRTTGELRHRWAMPEIVGAAIPVDLDAAGRRQHEQGMGPAAAAAPPLVQIVMPVQDAKPREPES